MLEGIWAVVFLVAGVLTIARHVFIEETNEEAENFGMFVSRAIMGFALVSLSVIVSWYSTVHPLFAWLCSVMPEPDSAVNEITALVVTFVAVLACISTVIFVTVLATSKLIERSKKKGAAESAQSASVIEITSARKR